MSNQTVTIDGNEAAAHVAHRLSEVCAIYPITPSSSMGELADEWSALGRKNIWGTVPTVIELQSEAGAAGAVHGALQAGALTTTFTASQGLLLMIPNMFKIAGELTPAVFHVSARTVATHALSIFGDHSDIMSVRMTGWALLASANVQEAHDNACISQMATLKSRIPFLHFFDGFRTSHEVQKLNLLSDDDLRALIDDELIIEHRRRALSPSHPVIRGTAQNPDVFFQGREAANSYYEKAPRIVQDAMDRFARQTGRQYHLFDYYGAPDAERVLVVMGSGTDTVHEAVDYLQGKGERVGVVKVRLFRPFSVEHFVASLPASVKAISVLDRSKESGASGEPLFNDIIVALNEQPLANGTIPRIIGGRYGLSSKEFTPAMAIAAFDNLKSSTPRRHFTLGINDDVTHTSLAYDANLSVEPDDVFRAKFYGLGADGTVGANKNSIKIIGDETELFAQGYFVYDSKKSGTVTVSHLRFGPRPIRSPYLVNRPNFVACHQTIFLEKYEMLADAVPGAVFLLNTPLAPEKVWDSLPLDVQEQVLSKHIKVYVIDAYHVARAASMGALINTIMQTCFFAISGVLPREQAIGAIKKTIRKTYEKKGEQIVQMNFAAVDKTLENLFEIPVPTTATSTRRRPAAVSAAAPAFVRDVLATIIEGRGDDLPVSAFPVDGTFTLSTSIWEKRNIATEIPVWDEELCIQCNKCVLVCPHACIRAKAFVPDQLTGAPETFKSCAYRSDDLGASGLLYSLQVSPEDCTSCGLCIDVCPAKNKREPRLKAINFAPQEPLRAAESKNWDFFLALPEVNRDQVRLNTVKGVQFLEPLFEFSGACSGCGETPYLKLLTQLYGDRLVIANATGCSSIYGANLPTTPYSVNREGRGPAWCNSLFEDNAEFGLGMRVSLDKQREFAAELLARMSGIVHDELVQDILNAPQETEAQIRAQRRRVEDVKRIASNKSDPLSAQFVSVADALVKHSLWIVGGDGWAYDIGYGGLDHVLAMNRNVNILVLDTGVYSNTGGQCSKATPLGAVAKFAFSGKPSPRKDLAMMAINYGNVYVAQIAFGANDLQTIKALQEAEAYAGPSLIIAYSHCIAHGIDMSKGLRQQKAIVDSAAWPLFRYDPTRVEQSLNPLQLDSKEPKISVREWAYTETRFKMLAKSNPAAAEELMLRAERNVKDRYHLYEQLAALTPATNGHTNGK
jgi:pyruvate-ferredoxin/flavodoxin oxidoreductase